MMLGEHRSAQSEVDVDGRDEHSMQLIEYALAITAFAAAVVLALIR